MEGVASATPFFLMLFFNLKNVGAVNHAANGAHCRGGFYARPKKMTERFHITKLSMTSNGRLIKVSVANKGNRNYVA
ncbi:MAG: hypothetical protein J5548_03355 [Prevotella sp.]|nr:hypothetical protein [Prevotella sp.]